MTVDHSLAEIELSTLRTVRSRMWLYRPAVRSHGGASVGTSPLSCTALRPLRPSVLTHLYIGCSKTPILAWEDVYSTLTAILTGSTHSQVRKLIASQVRKDGDSGTKMTHCLAAVPLKSPRTCEGDRRVIQDRRVRYLRPNTQLLMN